MRAQSQHPNENQPKSAKERLVPKIVSWNVNSIRAREEHLKKWLSENQIDVLGLQETKVQNASFPLELITGLGFQVFYNGQKSYNGVCILFKGEAKLIGDRIPEFPDEQKRVLAIEWAGILIINAYVPNGGEIGSEKFEYKMNWLEAFYLWIKKLNKSFKKIIVLGDFNIAPKDIDVHDPTIWQNKTLCSQEERSFLTKLEGLNLVDTFRQLDKEAASFSWWDYRGGSFRRNHGLRIDLILASTDLIESISQSSIHAETRGWEKPSDHAPVSIHLEL